MEAHCFCIEVGRWVREGGSNELLDVLNECMGGWVGGGGAGGPNELLEALGGWVGG